MVRRGALWHAEIHDAKLMEIGRPADHIEPVAPGQRRETACQTTGRIRCRAKPHKAVGPFLELALGAAFVPMAPAILRAQTSDLPSGPIRLVLPTASGGQADTIGRLIADRVGPAIDRTIIMEPKPGAGGLIAGEFVARAAPDGNTLLFVTGGHTILPGLYAKTIKFDAVKDFAFICQLTEASFAIAVAADHPAKSFADMLELSKRDPGKRTFSSVGRGLDPAPDRRSGAAAVRREVDAHPLSGRRDAP